MKHPLSFIGGFAAGLLAMYYLDARSGGQRRALVRDKVVATGHDMADYAEHHAKRIVDHVKGMVATGRVDRTTSSEPQSDEQLRERIRAQMGRWVSHPGAVHVEVEQGRVRLTGHVLHGEASYLVENVRAMAGVGELHNELQVHEGPGDIPSLQGGAETRSTPSA